MGNSTEEIEVTFYLSEKEKKEWDNPKGVLAASCIIDGEVHCTADIRQSMYTMNVTLVFSETTKNGRLKLSLDGCVDIGVYKKVMHKVKCRITRLHYDFFTIDKKYFNSLFVK